MNQMAALFYEGHPLPDLELKKANGALRVRVCRLMAGRLRPLGPALVRPGRVRQGLLPGPERYRGA